MDWSRAVDGYCERVGPEYWAEPVNALTNLAFLVAALLMWRRSRRVPPGRGLSVLLVVIGAGSWLFHTHAVVWAGLADVVPILSFVLVYLFLATRDFLHAGPVVAGIVTAGVVPYAVAATWVFAALPFFEISAVYWPVPLLISGYAVILRRRDRATARGLAVGAGLLCLSLTFRSLDEPVCAVLPLGTHFLWHLVNAAMLGWMIEVYRRHAEARLAGVRGPR